MPDAKLGPGVRKSRGTFPGPRDPGAVSHEDTVLSEELRAHRKQPFILPGEVGEGLGEEESKGAGPG